MQNFRDYIISIPCDESRSWKEHKSRNKKLKCGTHLFKKETRDIIVAAMLFCLYHVVFL